MPENIVHVSNTPIFDQLVAERGYEPKFPERLVRPAFRFVSEHAQSYMAPGAWIARPVPRVTPPKEKNVRLKVNVHPEEAMHVNTYGMEGFIRARLNEFSEKHPNATEVVISTQDEIDGTVTILIEGSESPDVVSVSKPSWSDITTNVIPEGPAERKLNLYQALALDERTIQTDLDETQPVTYDEVVEALKTSVPRPLWISDKEITDED